MASRMFLAAWGKPMLLGFDPAAWPVAMGLPDELIARARVEVPPPSTPMKIFEDMDWGVVRNLKVALLG